VLIGALVLFLGGWAFKMTVVLLSRHPSWYCSWAVGPLR
jgi:hypothetical protein